VVQIRVTRETWSPSVGAALATFGVTHKPPVLDHARCGWLVSEMFTLVSNAVLDMVGTS
jgi:hypothetical protein